MKREFVQAVDRICERVKPSRGIVSLVAVEDGACLFAIREQRTILATFAVPNQWVSTKDILEGAETALEVSTAAAIPGTMNHSLGINTPGIGMSEDDPNVEIPPPIPEDVTEGLWRSVKPKKALAAILKLGWSIVRQVGSHLRLKRPGWAPYTWAFHGNRELGPPILSKIAKQTGLQPAMLESLTEEDEENADEAVAKAMALNKDNDLGQIDYHWRDSEYLAQPKNDKLEAAQEGRLYNVFVYGDLVDADLRRELFGTDVPFEIAQLDDFMLANHVALDGSLLVNIHMEKGQKVVGLILSLTQDQLNLADQQMDGWSRMIYPVQGEQCFVYFVRPEAVQEKHTPLDVDKCDPKELEMGIKVELEHTDDRDTASRIAREHLSEDPKYYTKLKAAKLAPELDEACRIVTFVPKLTETCTFVPRADKTFTEGLGDDGAGFADQGTDTGPAVGLGGGSNNSPVREDDEEEVDEMMAGTDLGHMAVTPPRTPPTGYAGRGGVAEGASHPPIKPGTPKKFDSPKLISVEDTRNWDPDLGVPVPGTGREAECMRCRRIHNIVWTVRDEWARTWLVGSGCGKKLWMDNWNPSDESHMKDLTRRMKAKLKKEREEQEKKWVDAQVKIVADYVKTKRWPGYVKIEKPGQMTQLRTKDGKGQNKVWRDNEPMKTWIDGMYDNWIDTHVREKVATMQIKNQSKVSQIIRHATYHVRKFKPSQIAESESAKGSNHLCKAVFMAGGPASGKTTIANKLFMIRHHSDSLPTSEQGWRIVNTDDMFELLAKDPDLQKHFDELDDMEKRPYNLKGNDMDLLQKSMFPLARDLMKKLGNSFVARREPVIIDGTGRHFRSIKELKDRLEDLGYDCSMVLVRVDLETALQRNQDRDRVVPEDFVKKAHAQVNGNIPKFRNLFGGRFYEMSSGTAELDANKAGDLGQTILDEPLENEKGKEWLVLNCLVREFTEGEVVKVSNPTLQGEPTHTVDKPDAELDEEKKCSGVLFNRRTQKNVNCKNSARPGSSWCDRCGKTMDPAIDKAKKAVAQAATSGGEKLDEAEVKVGRFVWFTDHSKRQTLPGDPKEPRSYMGKVDKIDGPRAHVVGVSGNDLGWHKIEDLDCYMRESTTKMRVQDDEFVHFTTEKRAKEILKSKKLLMNPPYKKSGTDTVDAVSVTYGTFVPGTQIAHIPKDEGKIVGIVFKTNTRPKAGFSEETKWSQNVNLINPRVLPFDSAKSLVAKPKIKLGDYPNDYVLYEVSIPRNEMPQIKSDKVPAFLEWLRKEKGVRSNRTSIPPSKLHATQKEFSLPKVKTQMGLDSNKPILVSKDNYLLDGHHRWAAGKVTAPDRPIPVIQIDMGILQLVQVANSWSQTTHKQMRESDTVDGSNGTRAYKHAVAVILRDGVDGREVLVGKAKSEDARNGMLCFPGGGIDPEDGADPLAAAKREAFEETGLEVSPFSIEDHPEKPGVAFVVCAYVSGQPEPNQEFTTLQWLPVDAAKYGEYPDVYPQNRQILWRLDGWEH